MHYFIVLSLIALFGNCIATAEVVYLNKVYSGFTIFVNSAETGARLYLSTNDDPDYLKNIQLTTGETRITLDQLSDLNADDTPKFLVISNGLQIKTSNDDRITDNLNGFIYITTKLQADDPTFSVRVIKDRHILSTARDTNSTVVVLNTRLNCANVDTDQPRMSSYITKIQQLLGTNLHFCWGYPADNWPNVRNNQFFENPLYITNIDTNGKPQNSTVAFFENIEPLQVDLDYWYFTSDGQINMIVENKYVSNENYRTTSVSTTGLVMNSGRFKQHVVNFELDYTRSRTVGTLISTFPSSQEFITFILSEDHGGRIVQNYNNDSSVKHALLTTYMQASSLVVNSTSLYPGTFYCQYYGFSTDAVSTTSSVITTTTSERVTSVQPQTTTTSHVETTTKSYRSPSTFEFFIITSLFAAFKF